MRREMITLLLVLIVFGLSAEVYNVPADFTTIQGAINEADDSDIIIVSPGIYKENIDFCGKIL
ncbi:MAG: hypothetical protein P9X26_03985 [Candidatus Stygibacter frigidus]|nr:hypothetical protein [Candidatus Stygibacter frigidus]